MACTFFHLGLHKTASSWFQRFLFPNISGVRLLRTKNLDRAVSQAHASTVVISHEGLSGSLTPKYPGERSEHLRRSLEKIRALEGDKGIIIGFREHRSWLLSAHSQKAKKSLRVPNAKEYIGAFSLDDLSWCRALNFAQECCPKLFPFIYEELVRDPFGLVSDLCRFLDKEPPSHLADLLAYRPSESPKGRAGQLLSSSLYACSAVLFPANSLFGRKRLKANSDAKKRFYRWGSKLDRLFPPTQPLLEPELSEALDRDWSALLLQLGDRRGRDFSAYARLPEPPIH